MKLKEKVQKALKQYFILVTLITVLMMILGLLFDADRTFSYQVFASPLIYAAIGSIPVFLLERDRELSVKEIIISRISEFVLIEAIIMWIAFSADTIPTEKRSVVIGLALGIAVIYGLTFLVEYIFETAEAKELNEQLRSYQSQSPKS